MKTSLGAMPRPAYCNRTAAAAALLVVGREYPAVLLKLHQGGHWGEVLVGDARENEHAVV